MTDIQIFNFGDTPVRTTTIDGEPWFVLSDLCKVLEIAKPENVKARLNSEDVNTTRIEGGNNRGNPNRNIVNESGMYDVVLQSRKPQAKEFRRWITSDVLPSIRKHGAYMTDEKIEQVLTDPDTIIQLATSLKEARRLQFEAQAELEAAAPAIAYHENYIEPHEDLLTFRSVASAMEMKETDLREWLIENRWIYREKSRDKDSMYVNRYSEYANHKSDFKRIMFNASGILFNGEVYHTLKFTAQGAANLADAITRKGN